MKPFSITALDGGLNTNDPPSSLPNDQLVEANNVEFHNSTCGERRKGCLPIDLPASITADPNMQVVSFLHRHLPTTEDTASELWVMAQHLVNQFVTLVRKTTAWATVTQGDAIDVTANKGFQVSAQSLHSKLFLSFRSVGGINRLHVVDQNGTVIRRAGLAEPAVPTISNIGLGGFTGTRYYRVRYIRQFATFTLRSEPSDSVTFVPSGAGLSARITKPATISENETHWEVEASTNNADFYRVATVLVATTTYDDSVAYTPGYATQVGAVLSADIGDYSLIHSGKYLTADQDRLLIGGSWEDDALASRVTWTPVFGDPEGDGNDERIESDTDPYLDLDGFEGGPLTFLSNPVNGYIYAFKRSHTYRLSRTGQRNRAYEATNISKSLGALPGSVVEGVDQYGMPCLYFLDPEVGPCRTGGTRLIQSASRDILTTWQEANTNATIVSRALYFPEKQQVHWWIATDGSAVPNQKIILHTQQSRETPDGIRRGWVTADGLISRAYSTCLYAENIDANTTRSLILKPFIGGLAADGYVLRCDTGDIDNTTAYHASLTTKPFILANLLDRFGVVNTAILGKASSLARVLVTTVRDFGIEEKHVETTFEPSSHNEEHVIKQLKDLWFSQMYALQISLEDVATPDGVWEVNRIDMRLREEEKS